VLDTSHINPDGKFVGGAEKVDLASLPWGHVYGQPCEHFHAQIAGNKKALQLIADTILRAIVVGEATTTESIFATDGEGYEVLVKMLPDNPKKHPMVYNVWDEYKPHYDQSLFGDKGG